MFIMIVRIKTFSIRYIRILVQNGLKSNEKLKLLISLFPNCNIDDLQKFVGCCKNLKTLAIDTEFEISPIFVTGFIKHFGNLSFFLCRPTNIEQKQIFKSEFEGQFSTIQDIPYIDRLDVSK